MAGINILSSLVILGFHNREISAALQVIVQDAFTGKAAARGAVGVVIQKGTSRGVFSHEAGQGMVIDTLIICTMTALVIVISGRYADSEQDVMLTKKCLRLGLVWCRPSHKFRNSHFHCKHHPWMEFLQRTLAGISRWCSSNSLVPSRLGGGGRHWSHRQLPRGLVNCRHPQRIDGNSKFIGSNQLIPSDFQSHWGVPIQPFSGRGVISFKRSFNCKAID